MKLFLGVQVVTISECSVKKSFWDSVPNILKKRKEDYFACKSQVLTCHKVSQGLFVLWLYLNFCYCFQCYEERESSRRSLRWCLFVLKPEVHDMRNRDINRSSAILVWLASWLVGEYFLNKKTSWVEINHGVKDLCFSFLSLLCKDKTTTD